MVVQLVMVFGIGFLSAALLVLAFTPIVHQRAVRLTTARLDKAIPASIEELRIEKDQMRAQLAVSMRRLEVVIEQLKKKNVAHQTEISRKTELLTSLQANLEAKLAEISTLEEKNSCIQGQLSAALNERDTAAGLLLTAQRSLANKDSQLEHLASLESEHQQRLAERDSVLEKLQKHLQKSETLIAALQSDLSRARNRELSVADLHREIDQLEDRIEMIKMEVH